MSGRHALGSRSCSRRALLASGLGGLFLAPFLRQRELEAKALQPKRLILAFTPDSHPREWWPTPGGPRGFTLGGPLLDFVGLEEHLLFVRNLNHSWTVENHHEAGMAQLFTGQRFVDEKTRYAAGPSIDQLLLARTDLRGATPVSDAHIAVADQGGGDQRHILCYSGPGQPIPHEPDMTRVFANLFNGVSFGGTQAANAGETLDSRIKRAVLAVDSAELRKIQGFLGQEERARLELHLDALADLDAELTRQTSGTSVVAPAGCRAVDTSAIGRSDRDPEGLKKWANVAIDLVMNAFACDRTRVVDLAFGCSGSHHSAMLGLTDGPANSWHDVAHRLTDEASRKAPVLLGSEQTDSASAYVAFDRFWASQLASLAQKLAAVPEGDGSMLDNTLIYWGVESGTDHSHSPVDMPYLLIGGRNLGLRTGQLIELAEPTSAHLLHTSVLHAFGDVDAEGFGIEPSCGPLSGVLG